MFTQSAVNVIKPKYKLTYLLTFDFASGIQDIAEHLTPYTCHDVDVENAAYTKDPPHLKVFPTIG